MPPCTSRRIRTGRTGRTATVLMTVTEVREAWRPWLGVGVRSGAHSVVRNLVLTTTTHLQQHAAARAALHAREAHVAHTLVVRPE
eukprot:scaffold51190_cov29-Phaeocystis_antarctica.AAC.1